MGYCRIAIFFNKLKILAIQYLFVTHLKRRNNDEKHKDKRLIPIYYNNKRIQGRCIPSVENIYIGNDV